MGKGKGKPQKGGGGKPASVDQGKKGKKRARQDDGGMHKNDVTLESYERVIPLSKPKQLSKSDKAAVVDRKGASVKKHKSELAGLEDKDPEFFKFLRDNDKSLLEFGDGEDDEDDDAGDEDEDEEEDEDDGFEEGDGDLEGMEFGDEEDEDEDEDEDDAPSSRGKKSAAASNKAERPGVELTAALLAETADRACSGSASSLK